MLKKIERAQQLLKKKQPYFAVQLVMNHACRRGWSDLSTETSI